MATVKMTLVRRDPTTSEEPIIHEFLCEHREIDFDARAIHKITGEREGSLTLKRFNGEVITRMDETPEVHEGVIRAIGTEMRMEARRGSVM